MKISEKFKAKRSLFSLEVFPPRKNGTLESLWPTLEAISRLSPDYISVTYSAGGTGNRAFTADIAAKIQKEYGVDAVAHLTCVTSTREEVLQTLARLKQDGVENVLALRGDIVPDVPVYHDFSYASDLVELISAEGGFDIAGACYPECHPECSSLEEDIEHLKEKVDKGVTHLVTQLFFNNDDFYRFRDMCAQKGITVPMQAGIMPVTNKRQIERMVSMCGASIPHKLARQLSRYEGNAEALRDAGIAYATEQIIDLLSEGCDGIHLYSMNNAAMAEKIYGNVQTLFRHVNEA